MKTEWKGICIHANGVVTMQEYACISCKKNCRVTIKLNDDPPKICLKENKNANTLS
jgi:hypothetical protein